MCFLQLDAIRKQQELERQKSSSLARAISAPAASEFYTSYGGNDLRPQMEVYPYPSQVDSVDVFSGVEYGDNQLFRNATPGTVSMEYTHMQYGCIVGIFDVIVI